MVSGIREAMTFRIRVQLEIARFFSAYFFRFRSTKLAMRSMAVRICSKEVE
jgi:hypothetical protein